MKKGTPRESTIVNAIIRELKKRPGCLVRKKHGSAYGVAGDPDLYGSDFGNAFAIEVKRPGERPTPLQCRRLDEWTASRANCGVAFTVADALEIVGRYLHWRDQQHLRTDRPGGK